MQDPSLSSHGTVFVAASQCVSYMTQVQGKMVSQQPRHLDHAECQSEFTLNSPVCCVTQLVSHTLQVQVKMVSEQPTQL